MIRTIRSSFAPLPFLLWTILQASSACATPPTPFLQLTGEAPRDAFGWAVACPGDINGDGHNDLLVGAPGINPQPGKAYLYLSGQGNDSLPDAVLEDDGSSGLKFGSSVAGVGDMNGDGRADFVVGAPLASFSAGRALLFFGGAAINPNADVVLSPQYQFTGALFGSFVEPAGDLNGDGYGDILIGAPRQQDYVNESAPGRAYVAYGGVAPAGDPEAVIESPTPSHLNDFFGFGYSGALVGDVNGDGKPDLAIAQGVNPSLDRTGVTFLYLGGNAASSAPDASLESRWYDYPQLGPPQSVAPAGDLDGDGYDDFLVQGGRRQPAPVGSGDVIQSGAFVYFGGPNVGEIQNHRLFLPNDAVFGCAIAGGKDVNGDGHPDIVVGTGHSVLVYFGGPALDTIPNVTLPEPLPGRHFGDSVAEGDINGDGVADVIVGAWGPISPTSSEAGHVYVYDLSVPLPAHAFVRGGQRTIPLTNAPSQVCIQYEPAGGDYQNADVDLSSLRLVSAGTGTVSDIPAAVSKRVVESDTDQDGIPELYACFDRSDLARLFSSIRGRQRVDVTLEGRLTSGRKLAAMFSLTILGTGRPVEAVASIAPNPMNPNATLRFTTSRAGNATIRVYDVGGRLVRTVLETQLLESGAHQVLVAGADQHGAPLATGVYFYRIDSIDGTTTGRFVIAK